MQLTNRHAEQQGWNENECHIQVNQRSIWVTRPWVSQTIQGACYCTGSHNSV